MLPTGGGKSFLLGVMRYIEHSIMLVATTAKRDLNNPWHVWHYGSEVMQDFVVAAIETFKNGEFRKWCAALIKQRTPACLALHECHHNRLSSPDFQPHESPPAVGRGASATGVYDHNVTPDMEEELYVSIGRPSYHVIQTGTKQPNVKYRIAQYCNEQDTLESLKVLLARVWKMNPLCEEIIHM
ncbi:hypothetical protein FRC10_005470 [Ceratobasidium sp. 414]|nr:hypothetical protein FRC10_005470 [Ceratobasidium sp. 414]